MPAMPTCGLFSLLLLSASLSSAVTVHISPTGNDANAGTAASPFFSLNAAWTVITGPGDVVVMHGGLYRFGGTQRLQGVNGAPGNPVRVMPAAGEKPVFTLTDRNTFNGLLFIEFSGEHVYWLGVEIFGWYQPPGLKAWPAFRGLGARFCTFERFNIHHNQGGMTISDEGNLILNGDFIANVNPENFGGTDGLVVSNTDIGTEPNTVRGCRFAYNSDDGIDLWDSEGVVFIEDCWAWGNGFLENTTKEAGDGTGFKLGRSDAVPTSTVLRTVRRCLSVGNKAVGFNQNGAEGLIHLYNNAAYDNPRPFRLNWHPTVPNHIVNNVALDTADVAISYPDGQRTNTWQRANPLTADEFESLDVSQLWRPRKADGSLPDITLLKPKAGSSLVDAGTAVGLPFAGAAPDIGAYELGLAAPTTSAPMPEATTGAPGPPIATSPAAATTTVPGAPPAPVSSASAAAPGQTGDGDGEGEDAGGSDLIVVAVIIALGVACGCAIFGVIVARALRERGAASAPSRYGLTYGELPPEGRGRASAAKRHSQARRSSRRA